MFRLSIDALVMDTLAKWEFSYGNHLKVIEIFVLLLLLLTCTKIPSQKNEAITVFKVKTLLSNGEILALVCRRILISEKDMLTQKISGPWYDD